MLQVVQWRDESLESEVISPIERRRVEAAIAALGLPEYYTLDDLKALTANRTGRPLHVQPWPMPRNAPSGLWAATQNADYVYIDETLEGEHYDVALLHELTHVLLGHDPDEVIDDGPILAQLTPTLSTANIDLILGRARRHYDSPTEAFTERVARRLATRLHRGGHLTASDDPIAYHIARTLLPRETR